MLGTITSLGTIVGRHQVSELLIAIRDIDTGQLEDLLKRSHDHGITLHRMRFSIDEVRGVPTVIRRER